MLHRPRLIPCLLLNHGDLVKTVRFREPNYLGDPINAMKIFNEKCVDELCVQDISASKEGRGPDFDLRPGCFTSGLKKSFSTRPFLKIRS